MPVFREPNEGPTALHRLLLRLAPTNKHGQFPSLLKLSKVVGYHRSAMYLWLAQQKVTPEVAQRLIDYDKTRPESERAGVTRADFEPFVYNT